MSEIHVEAIGEDEFRVQVVEGRSKTTHRVHARRDQRLRYGGNASAEKLLVESFAFLLEREPKESILQAFDLSVFEQYFPESPEEIRRRLAG